MKRAEDEPPSRLTYRAIYRLPSLLLGNYWNVPVEPEETAMPYAASCSWSTLACEAL